VAAQLPIYDGGSTQLTITPAGDYQNILWSPDYEITNVLSANPTVSPRQDTTYYVTVENAQHCIVSAQVLVTVSGADLPDFLMPTAFSPNDDGLNDIFRPTIVNKSLEIVSFQIYDRWGVKVYDKDITGSIGWDGTYKNAKQPMGVYIYYITAKVPNGKTIDRNGNLTLMR
jgi:gliding motility-associated-like protein